MNVSFLSNLKTTDKGFRGRKKSLAENDHITYSLKLMEKIVYFPLCTVVMVTDISLSIKSDM